MPTYSYKCNACDYEFERRQRMTDEPVRKCPVCGQPEVRRVISQVGIVFKGSGFYVTDNRSGKRKGRTQDSSTNSAETTAVPKTEKETKSTTAPAAGSD
ncbi:MAG: zinc ribbon domain-containing protein [Anaerolineae bacterium]|nr:zinc ribbon domain-containing protein [Anaerolineae bacterium]MCO5190435.1 zinc ribbon domain-containing protein [Anaerolineae bacterium]MCO5193221.1 zinc ribbon domain-containing protein [Anaerolineae bacterium]MCO5198166.1 zinc ribbon domain-containing protein [Anaerolineae bacterium]MCO5205472.1 zinc ribbon domain-containing protein [Anaerolineae bacterium]